MDNSTLQRIQDVLGRSRTVAVAVGPNPTIDAMGSALAFYLSLRDLGKNVAVVSPTPPIVELSNLVGIDKVSTRYEGEGADLVVSFPYREGDIDKVSYTIENGYLNIVVKAGEEGLNFTENEVKYAHSSSGGQLDLLIVIGTPRISEIHSIFNVELLKNVTIINIDNKQENQGYGDIVLVSTSYSSISEQATQVMSDLRLPVDQDIAQNLLDGISYATDNFQSSNTSSFAFEMAGILMRQGAIRQPLDYTAKLKYQDYADAHQISQQPQQAKRLQQPQTQQPQQQRRPHFDQRRQQPQRSQQPVQSGFQNRQGQQAQRHPAQRPTQQPQFKHQPQVNPQPQSVAEPQPQETDNLNPPTDWLTPKVYKGSSNV